MLNGFEHSVEQMMSHKGIFDLFFPHNFLLQYLPSPSKKFAAKEEQCDTFPDGLLT